MAEYEREFSTSVQVNTPIEKNFLSGLTHIFEKFSLTSQRSNPEIRQQERQATKFLSTELYDNYFQMVDNGYTPTKQQERLWESIIQKTIDNLNKDFKHHGHYSNNAVNTFEYWAEKGVKFSPKNYTDLLLSSVNDQLISATQGFVSHNFRTNLSYFLMKSEPLDFSQIKSPNPLIENFLIATKDDAFCDNLANIFQNDINRTKEYQGGIHAILANGDKYSFRALVPILEKMPNVILKNIPLDNFLNILERWKKNKDYIYDDSIPTAAIDRAMQGVVEGFYRKDIDKKIEVTQELFSESYFKKVATEAVHNIENNFTMKTLPAQAKELLKSIQEQHSTVKTYKITLSEEDKFTMNNLLEKRIPEVLEKYLSIPPDYRTGLTNSEGKNAQDLMIESLSNFNTKITGIIENYAQNKVQDLSVTKRYSKSI